MNEYTASLNGTTIVIRATDMDDARIKAQKHFCHEVLVKNSYLIDIILQFNNAADDQAAEQ